MIQQLFNFIHWSPDPVLFEAGARGISWYALLFTLGLFGAYLIVARVFLKEKLDITYANILLILVAAAAVIGARFGEVFFYEWEHFRQHPHEIIQIWKGGLASHGAVIGIALVLWIYCHFIIKKPFLWVGDRIAAAIAFSGACVRFGNLMNSEIVGKKTNVAWAFIFESYDSFPRHPVQIYEGVVYLMLCIVLFRMISAKQKSNNTQRQKPTSGNGKIAGWFFIGMFLTRFFLEFTKEGETIFAGLITGQLLSLPLIVIGFLLLRGSKNNSRIFRQSDL